MRAILLFVTMTACATDAPVHYVAPLLSSSPPPAALEAPKGVPLDVDVDAEGKVKAKGFPAVSSDGRLAVSIEELGDGMRGFPNVVMHVFDATKGGPPEQTMQIVDVSDTADGSAGAPENFLLDRVRPRLAAVRAVLRDKPWVSLDVARLTVTLDEHNLRVVDESGRTLLSRVYDRIESGGCAFEPSAANAYSDPHRRFLLVAVSYQSGPDWCNMDDALELVVVR